MGREVVMDLKNLLRSGHTFAEDDYELIFRYTIFNSLILFNIAGVSIAAVIRTYHGQYLQASVDLVYILCAFCALLLARFSRASFSALMYFVLFFSYGIVTFLFYHGLNPLAGTGWYILLMMISFILTGRTARVLVFAASLGSIVYLSVSRYGYSASEIFLGLLPYFAAIFFLYIFDRQNKSLQKTIEMQKVRYAHLSRHDTLTDVPNRKYFFKTLERLLGQKLTEKSKLAILFIDLDNFKEINDTFGHHVGDIILVQTARRIRNRLRHSDMLARYGGDEFAIIVNGFDDTETVREIIERIFEAMREPVRAEDRNVPVSMSIGVTIAPDDGTEKLTLLKNADRAMYHAKHNGRDTYCFYADIT